MHQKHPPAARLRATIARTVDGACHGGISLSRLFEAGTPSAGIAERDRPYAMAAIYGTVRWYRLLEHLVDARLTKPLKDKDRDLFMLMVAGAHELLYMDTGAHAALNETVNAVKVLRKPWARGLVNAVLRGILRDGPPDASALPPAIATAHPDWLHDALVKDYGADDARALLDANNRPAPMTLRVNGQVATRDAHRASLEAAGIGCRPGAVAPLALTLETPRPVSELPGFADGAVTVQDEAAQLVAALASAFARQGGDPRPLNVLDACAAPGGKTSALCETLPEGSTITAVDSDPARMARLVSNLARGGHKVRCLTGDAAAVVPAEERYDLIIADVPCSATGVVRRHPDIKWLRREEDIAALAATQRALVLGLWPLLKRNGILVYITCSVLRAESDDVLSEVQKALPACQTNDPASLFPDLPAFGRPTQHGRQILTGEHDMDGFFHSVLTHQAP